MVHLPPEILYEIFCHLSSPQDLINCSKTCWTWNNAIHQSRIWNNIDLSLLDSDQLLQLTWQQIWTNDRDQCERSLLWKLQRASAVQLLYPSYITGTDLEYIEALLTYNTSMTKFHLERLQITESNRWGKRLFSSTIPHTVRELSLRQTLSKASMVEPLLMRLPSLEAIDLSYTLVQDSTLAVLGRYCRGLKRVRLDGVYTLSGEALKRFLEREAPLTVVALSLKYACGLNPDWIFTFVKRQIRTGQTQLVQCIELDGCDLVTFKDVHLLDRLTRGCQISHTAILSEDTLEGYRELIERLVGNVVNK